jgi:hypothetical protein
VVFSNGVLARRFSPLGADLAIPQPGRDHHPQTPGRRPPRRSTRRLRGAQRVTTSRCQNPGELRPLSRGQTSGRANARHRGEGEFRDLAEEAAMADDAMNVIGVGTCNGCPEQ